MRRYTGTRTSDGCRVEVYEDARPPRALDPRTDLRNHSQTGFEWGYAGSGPAQLALALAADAGGDDALALRTYQRLKFRLVGRLPRDRWELDEGQVRAALAAIDMERGRSR